MNRIFVSLAVAFQLLVLGWMVFERELVLQTGRTVYLPTQPVDPRDPFRGDYVRLDYDISRVPSNACRDSVLEWMKQSTNYYLRQTWTSRRIYTALTLGEDQVAHPTYVSDRRPEEGLFIRGRVLHVTQQSLAAKYGIEAYFVEEGHGRPIEDRRIRPDGIRVPLEMELALGRNGLAVLKGCRWSRLGIGLTVETNTMRRPQAITVTLVNVSDTALSIIDQGGGRPFKLMPDNDQWETDKNAVWVGSAIPPDVVTENQVIVLMPEESHRIQIDLNSPDWWVREGTNAPRAIGEISEFRRWRLIYEPPPPAETSHLKGSNMIWRRRIVSPAFWGGRID